MTSLEFLKQFGLRSLADLPPLAEFADGGSEPVFERFFGSARGAGQPAAMDPTTQPRSKRSTANERARSTDSTTASIASSICCSVFDRPTVNLSADRQRIIRQPHGTKDVTRLGIAGRAGRPSGCRDSENIKAQK